MKSGVECKSADESLGDEISIVECAKACKEKAGCNFFAFGTGSNDGKCYWEKTSTASCPEGWKQADYNFYKSDLESDYDLVIGGRECNSDDKNLGDQNSLTECAKACKEKTGCNFFIFGTGSKTGKCYMEKTPNAGCVEGWEVDDYNFYTVIGMLC